MKPQQYSFDFEVYNSIEELKKEDAALLQQAREFTPTAYAPYSNFFVAAVAKLNNGKIVKGTNQENASYPVGICAERALLGSASALFPGVGIKTMAITYHNKNKKAKSNNPVSPCGMCRQALLEYEGRWKQPIRLILSGMEGKVYIIAKASSLLPLSFTSDDLGK
jgi:cytidine deaminase